MDSKRRRSIDLWCRVERRLLPTVRESLQITVTIPSPASTSVFWRVPLARKLAIFLANAPFQRIKQNHERFTVEKVVGPILRYAEL